VRTFRRAFTPAVLYLILMAGCVPILIPFAWMVATSLKTRELAAEKTWLPVKETSRLIRAGSPPENVVVQVEGADGRVKIAHPDGATEWVAAWKISRTRKIEPQWENYGRILSPKSGGADDDFIRFLLNTLVIAGLCVIGQALTSALVGWGFARLRFAGKNALFMVMLATMMVPGQIGMIPVFMIFRQLGWIDTFLPLIVPAWFGSAFFAFLYRQFFLGIPLEMDDAARVDGAGPFRTFWSILLPLAQPVTVTVAVFTFLGAWNDFLGPLIYVNSDHKRTLSLALARFQGAYGSDIPALMAAATLMLIPVLATYFASQRSLIQGMVVSGVKG
jgi:ABC-type glycerol-3-phosphate transport system permease component